MTPGGVFPWEKPAKKGDIVTLPHLIRRTGGGTRLVVLGRNDAESGRKGPYLLSKRMRKKEEGKRQGSHLSISQLQAL